MDFSIINYYGEQASRCGYCKGLKCSIAHGMHAYTMSPRDYQALIDRGWRRSGQYCYKPHNQSTCCPCYTIRCDAQEFKLSKSHKKILKRMTRFLRDGKKETQTEVDTRNSTDLETTENGDDIRDEPKAPDVPLPEVDLEAVSAANAERNRTANELNQHCSENFEPKTKINSPNVAKKPYCDTSSRNYPCKKAKQMRLERRQAKMLAKGLAETTSATSTTAQTGKTLSDFIADTSPSDKHKLKLKLVHVQSNEFKTTRLKSYELYEKYQIIIHNDPPEGLDDFMSFLGQSPVKYQKTENGPPEGYGSFHQQYWLDDKLIAVAVIDILPHCLSSVYFFYDPDYSFLSLGTYASLREIEFVQQLNKVAPALKYYYMGFYIHSCPKMRYKGKLVPSELLCPEAYTWHLLTDEIRHKLNERKYQRFNADNNANDCDEFTEDDLDNVLLLLDGNICESYGEYIQSFRIRKLDHMLDIIRSSIYKKLTGESDERRQIIEYAELVGKRCAHRILYLIV